MKKQAMTLAVCLALTATAALASTNTMSESSIIPVNCPTKAESTCPKENCKQKFEAKMAKERQDLYCKLNLSKDQKEKAECLHQKTKDGAEPLFAKFHCEKAKLHELKAKKACPCEIQAQESKVKAAKQAIKCHMAKSRKEFESILNKCQLAKYKEIRKQKEAQWKKHHRYGACHKDGHNTDTNLNGPLGPGQEEPIPPCPCETK